MRPDRFERPTTWFEARDSIQLSYERIIINLLIYRSSFRQRRNDRFVANFKDEPYNLFRVKCQRIFGVVVEFTLSDLTRFIGDLRSVSTRNVVDVESQLLVREYLINQLFCDIK